MKTYALQKRLAAKILGIGRNRVRFDNSRLNEIGDAITKMDIADLIKDGAIKKLPVAGVRRRAGKLRQLRKKKRGKRAGKKKKTVGLRKKQYMHRIRKLRKHLLALKRQGTISIQQYKGLRSAAKSGLIKSKQDIEARIK